MLYTRLVQFSAAIIMVSSNGWLMSYIIRGRLGFGMNQYAVELAVSWISLELEAYKLINWIKVGHFTVYTLLEIFFLHCLHKSSKKNWLIAFIIWDLAFIGLLMGVMTILAIAGVPRSCYGITRSNCKLNLLYIAW
jgi:hypothetical protein